MIFIIKKNNITMNFKIKDIRQILNEGRFEDVVKKYSDKLDEKIVKKLSDSDPSGNNKYLEWMVKSVLNKRTNVDTVRSIKCFHDNVNRLSDKNINAIFSTGNFQKVTTEQQAVIDRIKKSPKDINSYPNIDWIDPICEYMEELKPKTESRVKIYEDDRWLVVAPLTHQASCSYGTHSNWCVSTSNSSYFQNYMNNGLLVFFIDKKGGNPKKPSANQYKFAVHISYRGLETKDWSWYSMEDDAVDPMFVLNFVPARIIELVKSYVNGEVETMRSKFKVNYDEFIAAGYTVLNSNNNHTKHLLPNLSSWETSEINAKIGPLIKTQPNVNTNIFSQYKSSGIVFLTIREYTDRSPSINVNTIFSWNIALGLPRVNNEILKSDVIDSLQRYGSYSSITNYMTVDQKNEVYENFVTLFNLAEVGGTTQRRTSQLQVGDRITFRPGGRTWGTGEIVTVTRSAEKSLLLSNGKRITKSNTSWKDVIGAPAKIVDQLTTQEIVTTETRKLIKNILKEYRSI